MLSLQKLDDEVEIDAAYVNGHVHPANRIENRVDRRKKENRDLNKRAVLVLRERHENEGEGGFKKVTAIAKAETQESVTAFVAKHF